MAKWHKRCSALRVKTIGARVGSSLAVASAIASGLGAVWAVMARPEALGALRIGEIPGTWIAAASGMIGAALLALAGSRLARQAAIRTAGLAGETQAARQLAKLLPGTWHLFNNLRVRANGGESEIDLTAVGPGGVWVVEVKNVAGLVAGSASDAELIHQTRRGRGTMRSPMRQCAGQMRRLNAYLAANGVRTWVRGAVYFADVRTQVQITGQGEVPWYTAAQARELARAMDRERGVLGREELCAVVKLLKRA